MSSSQEQIGEVRPALRRPLPEGRTEAGLRKHFLTESAIAAELNRATREQRKEIYRGMYDRLFAAVPDHPRLVRRDHQALAAENSRLKMGLLAGFLDATKTVVEFGCGDGKFAQALADKAAMVYGVDIADQTGDASLPDNVRLVVYDGFTLAIDESSVDLAFSDQLIEHLHPSDTEEHFRLVHRLLKLGGVYVSRSPNRLTGPHDVSGYFCRQAQGFHLKEWTYTELARLVRSLGYRQVRCYRYIKGRMVRLPWLLCALSEGLVALVPFGLRRKWLFRLLPEVTIVAVK